jgi:hypothetical protein
MVNVIGYTYEAGDHCIDCATERFGMDNNGFVPADAIDNEGNPIHPIFSTDEWWNEIPDSLNCEDCLEEIDYVE